MRGANCVQVRPCVSLAGKAKKEVWPVCSTRQQTILPTELQPRRHNSSAWIHDGHVLLAILACVLFALSVAFLLVADPSLSVPLPVKATRTITPPGVVPGETFQVRVDIEPVQDLAGLGLDESLVGFPPDWGAWQVTPIESIGATYKTSETAWVWLEVGEGDRKELVYSVTVPSDAAAGSYEIHGTLISQQPAFEILVEGATAIEVTTSVGPDPDTMTWKTVPHATGCHTITMVATMASYLDDVEYQFEETTGHVGATDSDWQDSPIYTDSELEESTEYCYRVQARSTSNNQVETGWSARVCTATPPCSEIPQPPTPNPLTWQYVPSAIDCRTITMVAITASHPEGVEYQFEETTGHAGATNSGWQDGPTYTDSGLEENTEYCYRVQARSKSDSPIETEWSPLHCVATPASEPAVPESFAVFSIPNPVPGSGCVFRLQLPSDSEDVVLYVYGPGGSLVYTAKPDSRAVVYPQQGAKWDLTDQEGRELPNGPYFLVLVADGKQVGLGTMVIQR